MEQKQEVEFVKELGLEGGRRTKQDGTPVRLLGISKPLALAGHFDLSSVATSNSPCREQRQEALYVKLPRAEVGRCTPDGTPKRVIRRSTSIFLAHKDWELLQYAVYKDLPESIYGAAMMATIRSTQTYHHTVHGVTICVYMGLVLNILMQFYVLYCTRLYICVPAVTRVQELYRRYHEEVFLDGVFSEDAWQAFGQAEQLCQIPLSQPFFFVAVLICWTATCWVDLLESGRFMSLWWRLRQPAEDEMTAVEDSDGNVLVTAADRKTKGIAIGLILVPKVAIAVYLWWLGARWLVATTSFQELLLNAVALAFITELDELIYMALVPEDIQVLVQSYKLEKPRLRETVELNTLDLKLPDSFAKPCASKEELQGLGDKGDEWANTLAQHRDRRLCLRIARMVFTIVVLIGLPIVYMRYLQQVLPGYQWDVHGPCESRIDALMLEF